MHLKGLKQAGLITISDQTVRAVHSCNSWFILFLAHLNKNTVKAVVGIPETASGNLKSKATDFKKFLCQCDSEIAHKMLVLFQLLYQMARKKNS